MAEALIRRKKAEGQHEIVLRLLEEVQENNKVSQAEFANRIGIAKGLANAYFNRCLQKGWIKLRQVPKQRYLYYLTPRGFSEKARLTGEFLSSSFRFYSRARADLADLMVNAAAHGHRRLVAIGAEELAEIALIVADGTSAKLVGFVDPAVPRKQIAGVPVVGDLSQLGQFDAALLTTLTNTSETYRAFVEARPEVTIYVPKMLCGLLLDKQP